VPGLAETTRLLRGPTLRALDRLQLPRLGSNAGPCPTPSGRGPRFLKNRLPRPSIDHIRLRLPPSSFTTGFEIASDQIFTCDLSMYNAAQNHRLKSSAKPTRSGSAPTRSRVASACRSSCIFVKRGTPLDIVCHRSGLPAPRDTRGLVSGVVRI
jgi:hypothetical protein